MAFSDTPTKAPGPPPPLGEHTEEVMAALGFDAAEIKSVRDHSEAEKEAMLIALLGDN
jgi:crotonobetainyl-CoA:carnitine CoA-transferase CaiB-like acyl-CoA transferase